MMRLKAANRLRRYIRGAIFVAALGGLAVWKSFGSLDSQDGQVSSSEDGQILLSGDTSHSSRRLLARPNCSPSAIEQFPKDVFSMSQRKQGALAVHVLVALYMFLALAIVCDDYFVPSLEKICEALNLQSDVAGATFMAAGSSAPELAASVIGVFIAKNDIGLGTVVGSAVFNIMFVIGLCALFAGMVVYLNWWPLFRDCLFYTISILALVWVISDEEVHWYESVVLLVLYAFYIILMFFNPGIEKWVNSKIKPCHNMLTPDEKKEKPEKDNLIQYEMLSKKVVPPSAVDGDSEEEIYTSVNLGKANGHTKEPFEAETKPHTHLDDGEDHNPFKPPDGVFKMFIWIMGLPLSALMFISCPDCRKERWEKWYMVTFFMSLVWISGYSYLLVWMITIIGHTLHIPDTMMGITFLAAGVSVPDAIASLLVVRDGYGDMAVSNAVGSNVFDILLCLGLPWFLSSVIHGMESIEVYSEGLTYSSLTLLSTVVFLLLSTHLNGWKMDKKYGIILLLVYVIFMVLASMYELNVFGSFHPPECAVDDD